MNRFEIVEGHYWFCADYHGGQGSDLYARLSKISGYFQPGILSKGPQSWGSQSVYNALEEKHGFPLTEFETEN